MTAFQNLNRQLADILGVDYKSGREVLGFTLKTWVGHPPTVEVTYLAESPGTNALDPKTEIGRFELVERGSVTVARPLLGRCLDVISTLEGEDTTEDEMLNSLKADVRTAMGIKPLVPGGLI